MSSANLRTMALVRILPNNDILQEIWCTYGSDKTPKDHYDTKSPRDTLIGPNGEKIPVDYYPNDPCSH